MIRRLRIGFSPCPNDIFIFYALANGKVRIPDMKVEIHILDVEELNNQVMAGELEVSKVSFHVLAYVGESYLLLRTGSALGMGCGPLLVSRRKMAPKDLKKVAVPGIYTTATLLLKIFFPHIKRIEALRYDQIIPKAVKGEVDAGLIIHEGRFTYESYGLKKVADLGEMWERQTGLPIPLGGIVARRDLGKETISRLEEGIRESLDYSFTHFQEAWPFIKGHAQEMEEEEEVIKEHIALYVNPFTRELGDLGKMAVERLLKMGREKGLLPHVPAITL